MISETRERILTLKRDIDVVYANTRRAFALDRSEDNLLRIAHLALTELNLVMDAHQRELQKTQDNPYRGND